ncbi:MAG: glycerophosphodiester phosphodiesterase family protein, partial [Pseudonocardiaceae bacterium]
AVPLPAPIRGQVAQVPARIIGIPVVGRGLVRYAHGRGFEVHVWTVDQENEMPALLDLGVDGLMTDQPDVLRAVLQARRAWPGAEGRTPR